MVRHCLLFAAAAVVAGAAACAPLATGATPDQQVKAADFEAAISRLQKDDPQSPETLTARLEYADFLSRAVGPGCEQQLATAQSQLDTVAGRPAIDIVLPLGPAQIAADEYKVHLARATCGGQTPLESELRPALEAAQHAVALYRNALDYQSAAIMQFNVAATYRELADTKDAVSALEAAIAMDQEYGFRKDAEDNTKLLLQWKDQKVDDGDVAAATKDFPARTPEFKFGWSDSDADVALTVEDTSVIQGKIIQSRHAVELKRQIREGSEGWVVTNEAGTSSYNLGGWPVGANVPQWPVLYFLASALLSAPDIEVSREGDFKSVRFPEAFGTSLAAQMSAQISSQTGTLSRATYSGLGQRIIGDPDIAFAPDFIESKAEQDYGLETGTWIGATLEQGVWYQMSAPLFLPGLGLGHFVVQHNINFAFTRELPCTTGSDRFCAEIVIRATPDTNDLKSALEEADPGLKLPDNQPPHVWSRTDIRLVIDPKTLLPQTFDIRQSWYDGLGKRDPIIESIRTVSTSIYH